MMLCAAVLLISCLLVLGGCDVTDAEPEPVEIETPPPPDAALGRTAFVTSCAPCHASADGFDIAFFGFSDLDIVRRGVAHVDTTTARHIVAFIRSLDVSPAGRNFRPFQPGGQEFLNDGWAFWERLFGTIDWPSELTPEALRSIDPKDVAVSLDLPVWSSEPNESDWMPERPLSAVGVDGGVMQDALDNYHASPTNDGLLEVIRQFRRVTTEKALSAAPVCEGHKRPEACFEAHRWIASLAGMHLLREGEGTEVPFAVARLWWETGEAAIRYRFLTDPAPLSTRDVVRWLYLGYIFAPEAFPDRGGYMGEYLQESGMEYLAVFAMLRRMVGDGLAHQGIVTQHYADAFYAIKYSPSELTLGIARFSYQFLLDRVQTGLIPQRRLSRASAREFVRRIWDTMVMNDVYMTSAEADEITAMRDELLALLDG